MTSYSRHPFFLLGIFAISHYLLAFLIMKATYYPTNSNWNKQEAMEELVDVLHTKLIADEQLRKQIIPALQASLRQQKQIILEKTPELFQPTREDIPGCPEYKELYSIYYEVRNSIALEEEQL